MFAWLLACLGVTNQATPSSAQPTIDETVLLASAHPFAEPPAADYSRPLSPADRTYHASTAHTYAAVSGRPPPYIIASPRPPALSRPHRPSVPVSFPLSIRLKSTATQLCAHPHCNKPASLSCGRCMSTGYCAEAHRQASWRSGAHLPQCTPCIATRAAKLGFSVSRMHVPLRPRRDAPATDPYLCWAFNSAASFQCGTCQRRWSSAKASAAINLRSLQLVKVYKERCVECNKDAMPCFFNLPESVASVLVWLRDLRPGDSRHRGGHEEGDPHLAEHCERCLYGAFPHSH